MHAQVGRPDDSGYDDEDAEYLDANSDKMDPAACGRFEGRQTNDIGIHRAIPEFEKLLRLLKPYAVASSLGQKDGLR
jgi:hypothetical protein